MEELFPGDEVNMVSTGVSRPRLPQVPASPVHAAAMPAERVWRHTEESLVADILLLFLV